ncbi:C-C motif chemokine 24 [Dasypus novemcinctus]|uniref:C-C motif chemokine 24 n=1 Tax=Dasypus novemcinctus TaxID=9361 RepID=UPI000328D5D0|nr:C-C motif chemokine 24 [Dasypus novemcinctus]
MAGPVTVATGLLLLALWACHLVPADSVVIPSSCCMSFVSKKIPEGRVASYQLANGSVCPKAGVIFVTKKGQKFCGDPKQPWVQRFVKSLHAKQKKLPAGPRGVKTPFQRHPPQQHHPLTSPTSRPPLGTRGSQQ